MISNGVARKFAACWGYMASRRMIPLPVSLPYLSPISAARARLINGTSSSRVIARSLSINLRSLARLLPINRRSRGRRREHRGSHRHHAAAEAFEASLPPCWDQMWDWSTREGSHRSRQSLLACPRPSQPLACLHKTIIRGDLNIIRENHFKRNASHQREREGGDSETGQVTLKQTQTGARGAYPIPLLTVCPIPNCTDKDQKTRAGAHTWSGFRRRAW